MHIINFTHETPANMGTWCFLHAYAVHSCCGMSAASVLFSSSIALPAVVRCSALTGSLLRIITLGNIKPIWFAVPRHVADAGDRRLRVIKSAGFWEKDLNYLGERFNPLPVCVIWGTLLVALPPQSPPLSGSSVGTSKRTRPWSTSTP